MDLQVSGFEFGTTEVTVAAMTENGLNFLASMFGAGAVSVNLLKSYAGDFIRFATQKGLLVQ